MLINQGIQRRIATFEKANLDEDAGAGGAGTEGASIAKTLDPAALGEFAELHCASELGSTLSSEREWMAFRTTAGFVVWGA